MIENYRIKNYRRTEQFLLPVEYRPTAAGEYDIYPAFQIDPDGISLGFASLAARILGETTVVIDGACGVFWEDIRQQLDRELRSLGATPTWISVADALWSEEKITSIVEPFLGGDDPLWGTRFTGDLQSFFDPDRLASLLPDPVASISILYGCGSALAGWKGHLLYLDLPKNELQFRMRAGLAGNLGRAQIDPPKVAYKRLYFVDWPAERGHRQRILERIDTFADTQRLDDPVWISGDAFRDGLDRLSQSPLRVRPWFEPGPWGGDWMKRRISGLAQNVPNYAWSFELIVPENGILFSDGRYLLEAGFDWLMFHRSREILGEAERRFGTEFPIRFDYLDTFNGGNLSVQCHPRPDYIREHFGENFTQDETYYIVDCEPGARVWLGLAEDCDPAEFRRELEESAVSGREITIERYVHSIPAHRGDLFLIPNGTVHCSGRNNLVLEISATPYIFTFKMYDWVRRDLEGNLRTLNIARAWENIYFERRGRRAAQELVAHPHLLARGDDWQLMVLPTHPDHFYSVHRYEFSTSVEADTDGACHVMNLVQGSSIIVETANGQRQRINFAETFIIPAAAGSYRLINEGSERTKVVKAFVKPEAL